MAAVEAYVMEPRHGRLGDRPPRHAESLASRVRGPRSPQGRGAHLRKRRCEFQLSTTSPLGLRRQRRAGSASAIALASASSTLIAADWARGLQLAFGQLRTRTLERVARLLDTILCTAHLLTARRDLRGRHLNRPRRRLRGRACLAVRPPRLRALCAGASAACDRGRGVLRCLQGRLSRLHGLVGLGDEPRALARASAKVLRASSSPSAPRVCASSASA